MHRCRIHCPGGGDGFVVAWIVAVGVAAYVLWQVAWVLAVAAVALAVVAAAGAYASKRWCYQLSVVYWRQRQAAHYPVPVRADMRALRRGSLAIEAPRHALTAAQAPMTQAAAMAVTVTAGSKRANMTEPI